MGNPFPSPGNLPNPGIKHGSTKLPANSLLSEPPGKPKWTITFKNYKPQYCTPVTHIILHGNYTSIKKLTAGVEGGGNKVAHVKNGPGEGSEEFQASML